LGGYETREPPSPPPLKADTATIAVKAEPDGKLRGNYQGWAEVKILLPGEPLELRWEQSQVWARRTASPSRQP
jgi:hypothetical protein